jgi:hypothetical protein
MAMYGGNSIMPLDFWEAKLYNKGVKKIHSEVAYGYDEDQGGAGSGKARELIEGGRGVFLYAVSALASACIL